MDFNFFFFCARVVCAKRNSVSDYLRKLRLFDVMIFFYLAYYSENNVSGLVTRRFYC